MVTYYQSGTGTQLNEDQIKSGSFDKDTFFIEGGSGARKTQQDFNAPALSTIQTPTPAPSVTQAPTLPTPQAGRVQDQYFTSATQQLGTTRKTLEDSYKQSLENTNKKIEASEMAVASLTAKQQGVIDDNIEPLLKPFRQDLETSERDRLKVEENYFANQSLVGELERLLTEGNNYIAQQKALPVHQQVVNAKRQKAMSDVAARAGVIEAVMSARNGQIAQAYNLIDRSSAAITADRQDQLSYYNTLLDFYETAKDEEGKKLFQLKDEEKGFLEKQTALLEMDLEQAQTNVDNIKSLMTDPDTAMFMAEAGITLNDAPDVVARKMGEQAKRQEIKDFKNEMALKGYSFSPYQSSDSVAVQVGDQTMYFKKPEGGGGSFKLSTADRTAFLGLGFSEAEAQALDEGIRQYGIDTVIETEMSEGSMTQQQADGLRKIYGGSSSTTNLSREALSTFYNIPDDEEGEGWFGWGDTNKAKLDAIEATVARYRAIGMKDEDILKELQKSQ